MDQSQVTIRQATETDAPLIVRFLRCMLSDMAALGGHPVATDNLLWTHMEAEFRDHPKAPDCVHLLAERIDGPSDVVGWAFARSTERDPILEPARVLHIHALYVSPAYRRRGIGRALLERLLAWGQSVGCVQAELNVLVNNPARSLYRNAGFAPFEIEMTRDL